MRDFEKHVLDIQAREIFLLWYYRIVPYRSVCEGLEDQPQPLTEPGFGDDLARQIRLHAGFYSNCELLWRLPIPMTIFYQEIGCALPRGALPHQGEGFIMPRV
jgi:hypothetical protein